MGSAKSGDPIKMVRVSIILDSIIWDGCTWFYLQQFVFDVELKSKTSNTKVQKSINRRLK
jgi:hypothetical protein